MKKALSWFWDNILFLETLFLLAFIPLYPKLPLVDVKNTWVYVRVEDFLVFFVFISFFTLLIKRKISLKTPLTIPIMAFWLVGAVATIHGVVLIFPTIPNVFPNVAFLAFLRHIEYMSLFFVAYVGIREKRSFGPVVAVVVLTLLGVVAYGLGQRFLGFPAFLTMNEEFAKGIPITLSQLSRLPSTFAGHYDLAAYLVLVIPILVSLIFGFRNIFIKLIFAASVLLGGLLMFMTVSRVSLVVLFVAIFGVMFFQKKKLAILSIPLIICAGFLFIALKPTVLTRFTSTVSEVNVLVDGLTGESIGHVKFVPKEYFKDKLILQRRVKNKDELTTLMVAGQGSVASVPGVLKFELLPAELPLVEAVNVSNGEILPQGTGYINLALSPVTKRLGNFFYELPEDLATTSSAQILVLHGDFIVKRASAYDLSFTTRFQGEWPNALRAFARNIFLGSGYGSVSLAVDNNYFRMLGETGMIGISAFFAILLSMGIYIKKILPQVESKAVRAFVIGFAAGVVGLALNATLIDVFEASKIAFLLWLLTGVTLGILSLYNKKDIDLYKELKSAATSSYAVVVYLFIATVTIFSPMLSNFFVGDDFTWFRWVADCTQYAGAKCPTLAATIYDYFRDADGFFYRPGTKAFFNLMYSVFWLNQVVYHAVSLFLHFVVAALFFLIARKILKSTLLGATASVFFLIMSGPSEAVFWISSVGYLFTAMFALAALLFFDLWQNKKQIFYYCLAFVSIALGLLFHEVGVVVPLLVILYQEFQNKSFKVSSLVKRASYWILFVPVVGYLIMRFVAGSHWSGGDYSYNIIKLPFNIVGNIFGYLFLTLFGPLSLSFYETLRNVTRAQPLIVLVVIVFGAAVLTFLYKKLAHYIVKDDKRIYIFGILFFVISLLPFLGLGNIASRYSYLASLGVIIIVVFVLSKVYRYLITYGRDVAIASTLTLVAIFSLLHIIQLQQVHLDWHGAGVRSERFFISVDDLFTNELSTGPAEIHFVNVPIKTGDAWVFPVGLNDAVWFAYKNPEIKIYLNSTVKEALGQVGYTSQTKRVFKFNDDGSLKEYTHPKPIIPTPAPINFRLKR